MIFAEDALALNFLKNRNGPYGGRVFFRSILAFQKKFRRGFFF